MARTNKNVNLSILLTSAMTEVVKKNCKAALKSLHIHTNDWDEIRESSGKIVALTVFIRHDDAVEAVAKLKTVPGVSDVLVNGPYEPVCFIASPLDSAVVSGIIALQILPANNKITKIDCLIDNIVVGSSMAKPYSISIDTASLANGNTDVQLRASDKKGKLLGLSPVYTFDIQNAVAESIEFTGENLDDMLANGWQHDSATTGVTTSVTDGIFKIEMVDAPNLCHWDVIKWDAVPTTPAVVTGEIKLKITNPTSFFGLFGLFNNLIQPQFSFFNDGTLAAVSGGSGGVGWDCIFPIGTYDSDWHVYKMVLKEDSTTDFYVDDVLKINAPLQPDPFYNTANYGWCSFTGLTGTVEVDYMKWTAIQ
jgi:hypothetical protein